MKRLRPGLLGVVAALLAMVTLVSLARQAWRSDESALPPAESHWVQVNQATALEWADMPGIGPVLAQRIVHLREARGGFQSIEELRMVKGVGEKKLRRLRPHLRLGGEASR